MPYKKPCGESNRGPLGTPGYDYETNDDCLSAMKRGGKRPSRKYKKSKRVFRKKSRSTRRR
jgi:hypothetical protein